MAAKDWSETASLNILDSGPSGTGGTISIAEGMARSDVNNAIRSLMAQVATQFGKINYKGADIASATTTNLANATGNFVDITGTTTITGLGTVAAGQVFFLRFTGALTFTYNATSLILPGAANITTANGDVAVMLSLGSGNWKCAVYGRNNGAPVSLSTTTDNAVIRADGALGRLQNSGVIIDDTNAVSGIVGLTVTGGGSLTGTWSNLGTVTTVDINGGTLDGTVIGGATAAAATVTTLTATGGGSLTGTWSNLGTVTTIDINGGTVDGTVIGGAAAAAGTFTTIAGTTGTFSGAVSAAGASPFTLTYVDNGATGPIIAYVLDTASPAVNDITDVIRHVSRTSTAANAIYSDEYTYIIDPINATATGGWFKRTLVNGVLTNQIGITAAGVNIPLAFSVTGSFTASAAVAMSPANAAVTLSPTGTGVVTINPATAGTMNNVVIGGSTPLAATVTALTATGAVALSPANANVVLSPTGSGVVTINPATLGTMNKVTIGGTTPAAATVTTLAITEGAIISGTWTPADTANSNLDACTASLGQYMRVGNVVTASVEVLVDPTATGTTTFELALPVASNFGANSDLTGSGSSGAGGQEHALVRASAANDTAVVTFTAVSTASHALNLQFTYRII